MYYKIGKGLAQWTSSVVEPTPARRERNVVRAPKPKPVNFETRKTRRQRLKAAADGRRAADKAKVEAMAAVRDKSLNAWRKMSEWERAAVMQSPLTATVPTEQRTR
jgi:hypothetical protein